MDTTNEWITKAFETEGVDALLRYIAIPALSPAFDPDWEATGAIEEAAVLWTSFAQARRIPGLRAEIQRLEGRSPALVIRVPASSGESTEGTVLLYGHLDKQPAPTPWSEGRRPFTPSHEGDLLFGRGVVDDGYSAIAALLAIEGLAVAGEPYPACLIVIEASEESGSPDLGAHIDALRGELDELALVICLDSGGMDFNRLWLTSSLRGNLVIFIDVEVLAYGMHSGEASGLVPSSFRILRQLLDRIEDAETGRVLVEECYGEIPPSRREEADALAALVGDDLVSHIPTIGDLSLMATGAEGILNQTWRPTISYTGIDGIPSLEEGGNVLRAHTTLKLSLRLAPTADAERANAAVIERLMASPPSNATVRVWSETPAQGWNCAPYPTWLAEAVDAASQEAFGTTPGWCGEGGSIPFLADLGTQFPEVPIVATGALGPGSNPHGPDESLRISMGSSISVAVSSLLRGVATRAS
jgi:acetylornithine deacetylase/succinyl-diaminopimelate desuccinylase-like protein